jgi:N-methylhydantoinase B/oxoprolinase/acetone carboxylase alpha subunit
VAAAAPARTAAGTAWCDASAFWSRSRRRSSRGLPGALGRTAIARADGTVEELPGVAQAAMRAGDVLIVETPGGGGFGAV